MVCKFTVGSFNNPLCLLTKESKMKYTMPIGMPKFKPQFHKMLVSGLEFFDKNPKIDFLFLAAYREFWNEFTCHEDDFVEAVYNSIDGSVDEEMFDLACGVILWVKEHSWDQFVAEMKVVKNPRYIVRM
jgi:hypothetical protein